MILYPNLNEQLRTRFIASIFQEYLIEKSIYPVGTDIKTDALILATNLLSLRDK